MSEKRISRRELFKGLAAVAAGTALAACAPKAEPTAVPTKAPEKPAEKPAATAVPAMKEKTIVRYEQVIGPLDKQVDMFNEQSDTIHVEYELAPWGEHAQKLLIDAAAGTLQDTFFVGVPWWIQVKRAGITLALNDFLEADNVDMSGFVHPLTSDWVTQDGKITGAPTNGVIMRGLGYNMRILRENGVEEPTPDWTWDTLVEVGKKVHKPPDVYGMLGTITGGDVLLSMIWQNGGKILNEEETKSHVNEPETVEVVQEVVDWVRTDKFAMSPGDSPSLGDQPIGSDKVALWGMVLGDWDSYLQVTRDDTIDSWMTDWPTAPQPKRDVWAGSIHMECIWKETKVPKETWEFFKWRSTSEEANAYQVSLFPTNWRMQHFVETAVTNEKQAAFLLLHLDVASRAEGEYWGPTGEFHNAIRSEIELAVLGEKTPQEAMDSAAETHDSILADM